MSYKYFSKLALRTNTSVLMVSASRLLSSVTSIGSVRTHQTNIIAVSVDTFKLK